MQLARHKRRIITIEIHAGEQKIFLFTGISLRFFHPLYSSEYGRFPFRIHQRQNAVFFELFKLDDQLWNKKTVIIVAICHFIVVTLISETK